MPMKVWLPYIRGGSGSDVFTRILGTGLRAVGFEAIEQPFPHSLQYAPWVLRYAPPPEGTDITVANTWNGFAFRRRGSKLVTVEHLFVLDPALAPFRTFAQAVFHDFLVRLYERWSQRASDVQVAVSQYTAEAHHRVLGDPKPQVILNGVDTDFFTPDPAGKAPLHNRPLRLLFVGNLTRRKGIDLIPPIMHGLGHGFELEYAVGLRSSETLSTLPNARSLGRLDHHQVREAFRRADLLLFPTRLEGLPLAAMEAMACATPVVASRASSLPEVVYDGITGCLCKQDQAESFIDAIRNLAANRDRLAHMGRTAHEAAASRFSLKRMVADYVHLFESLIEKR